ncbi:LOW QUALITY PROTEIN: hypothetical protein PanWU01x14_035880 [Parasponia andersonii]|uniref:Uncharacterized protein n=1 Tax=Parasponia andersonii TaxID=3476 RepID=A0A2P5DSA6_PARAD|nr:LOW QUALITY PROTEIN: hypothetical protein PanWU01x14_035880 [Parasponia andersonii]
MPNLRSRLALNDLAQQGRRYRRKPAEKKLILSIPASKVRIQCLRNNAIAVGNFDKLWWT